jgi:hypothetical protein
LATVCLIYEFNCYVSREPQPSAEPRRGWLRSLVLPVPDPSTPPPPAPQTYASVWVKAGALGEEDDYDAVARKVVGPLPSDQAQAAVAALRSALEAAGVEVIEETVADD